MKYFNKETKQIEEHTKEMNDAIDKRCKGNESFSSDAILSFMHQQWKIVVDISFSSYTNGPLENIENEHQLRFVDGIFTFKLDENKYYKMYDLFYEKQCTKCGFCHVLFKGNDASFTEEVCFDCVDNNIKDFLIFIWKLRKYFFYKGDYIEYEQIDGSIINVHKDIFRDCVTSLYHNFYTKQKYLIFPFRG